MPAALSALGAQVRQQDHDRYLTLVFAPETAREPLFALLAFNQELARIAERVSEPLLGEMRYTWWRDAVEAAAGGGPLPEHPVVDALAPLVSAGRLPPKDLLDLIEARRRDLDPKPFLSLPDLKRYAEETSGLPNRLVARLCGLEGASLGAAEDLGTAWGLLGHLRAFQALRRRGRVWLPQALLEETGLTRRDLMETARPEGLAQVARSIAGAAERCLERARAAQARLPKGKASPFLLGTLTRLYLDRLARCGGDPGDPRFRQLLPQRIFRLSWAMLRRRW